MTTVAIFGAGIAGLTVAHELSRRGYRVQVYEANEDAGGFFRSARLQKDRNMPSSYSWHGFGPWYHNAFDVMKQIPADGTGTLYEKGLSRPIDFGVAPDHGRTEFDDSWILPMRRMFRMTRLDCVRWGWLMLKTWAANLRSLAQYSQQNAAEAWRPLLSPLGWKTWRASFGPWIGSDWTKVSLHTAGQFYRRLLISWPPHEHPADEEGPAWKQGSRDGWLLLRGPSSECWFDRWIAQLEHSGVRFCWSQPLARLDFDGTRITAAHLESGDEVSADLYVLATDPFSAARIVERTPSLAQEEQLRLFQPLIQDGPHTQVSFRLAFAERIAWPRERAAIVVADSEFNLTLFAVEQVWPPAVDLGTGVQSLWTGTACVGTVPGRLYGLPVVKCTKEQFIDEVKAQLCSCESLDALVREANGGRSWRSFPLLHIEVWHEWLFSPAGIQPHQPKWVTTTHTQPYRPTQATSIPNLALAGAHTKTAAEVWSIEGAVESGRRAAQVFEPSVQVLPQYKPRWLRALGALDDLCYALGAPHFLDLALVAGTLTLVAVLPFRALRRARSDRRLGRPVARRRRFLVARLARWR